MAEKKNLGKQCCEDCSQEQGIATIEEAQDCMRKARWAFEHLKVALDRFDDVSANYYFRIMCENFNKVWEFNRRR
ncbi:MAG: hypothetical protein QW531_04900 [Thermoplasmata archaeon]